MRKRPGARGPDRSSAALGVLSARLALHRVIRGSHIIIMALLTAGDNEAVQRLAKVDGKQLLHRSDGDLQEKVGVLENGRRFMGAENALYLLCVLTDASETDAQRVPAVR